MRDVIVFLLFIVLIYLLGLMLAYPLERLLPSSLELPFRRYVDYAIMFSALILSSAYLSLYGLLSFAGAGYSGGLKPFFKILGSGFIFGFLTMLLIETLLLALGIHKPDAERSLTTSTFVPLFLKAFGTGLLVALFEETVFRGAFFTGLQQRTGTMIAIFFTSLIYAAVHFPDFPDLPPNTDTYWLTGITWAPEMFKRFQRITVDHFLTLLAFGLMLGLLRVRYKSIAACIGVHAGAVMLIKISHHLTNRSQNSDFEYLVSQENSTLSWITFGTLLFLTALLFYKMPRAKKTARYVSLRS